MSIRRASAIFGDRVGAQIPSAGGSVLHGLASIPHSPRAPTFPSQLAPASSLPLAKAFWPPASPLTSKWNVGSAQFLSTNHPPLSPKGSQKLPPHLTSRVLDLDLDSITYSHNDPNDIITALGEKLHEAFNIPFEQVKNSGNWTAFISQSNRGPVPNGEVVERLIAQARIGASASEPDFWLDSLIGVRHEIEHINRSISLLTPARQAQPTLSRLLEEVGQALRTLRYQTNEFYRNAPKKWIGRVPNAPSTPATALSLLQTISSSRGTLTLHPIAEKLPSLVEAIDQEILSFSDINHPRHSATDLPIPTVRTIPEVRPWQFLCSQRLEYIEGAGRRGESLAPPTDDSQTYRWGQGYGLGGFQSYYVPEALPVAIPVN